MRVLSKERLDDFESRGPAGVTNSDFMRLLNQSRAALTLAARVAELERELAEARSGALAQRAVVVCNDLARIDKERIEWQSTANALRDALVKARDLLCEDSDSLPGFSFTTRAHECITAALIAHPAANLAAHDAEVLQPYKAALLAWQDADREGENPSDDGARWDGLRELARSLTKEALAAQAQEVKP